MRFRPSLGARDQWLPLDPPTPGAATLGGVLAVNAAGPRRHGYGTARDLVIGLRVVAADGQLIRGGGQGREERGGLRPREALHRLARHARHHRRRDAQAAPPARGRGRLLGDLPHPRRRRPRPRRCSPPPSSARPRWCCWTREPPRPPRPARGCRPSPLPTVLVAFDGLARAVAWQGDETARRLRAAGARAVDVLDAGGTARALEAVREARRLLPDPVALATVGVLPADAGGLPRRGANDGRGRGLRARRRRAGGARTGDARPRARARRARAPAPPPCSPRGARRRGRAAGTSPSSGRRSACAKPARCGIRPGRALR